MATWKLSDFSLFCFLLLVLIGCSHTLLCPVMMNCWGLDRAVLTSSLWRTWKVGSSSHFERLLLWSREETGSPKFMSLRSLSTFWRPELVSGWRRLRWPGWWWVRLWCCIYCCAEATGSFSRGGNMGKGWRSTRYQTYFYFKVIFFPLRYIRSLKFKVFGHFNLLFIVNRFDRLSFGHSLHDFLDPILDWFVYLHAPLVLSLLGFST